MQNRRWLIVGITGSGKTYFTVNLIKRYVALKQRKYIVVVDSTDALKKDLPWLKHCEVKPRDFSTVNFEGGIRKFQHLLFEVSGLLPDQDVLFMDALCSSVMEVGNTLLVVDEAHRYLPRDNPSDQFLILLREGRKQYVDTIMVTQFPVDLNLIARRQANSLVIFKLLDDTDTKKVSFYSEMQAEEIRDLDLFDFILKDRNSGQMIRGKL